MTFLKFSLLLLPFFIFSACASKSIKNDFEKVSVGMDRSTVLDLIGSPTTVKRERQPHIWYYKFVHNDIYEVQEVHFTGDYVSYVGEPKKRDPLPVETVELSDVEKDIYFSKKKEPSPSYEESVEQTTKGSPEQRVIPDFKEIK